MLFFFTLAANSSAKKDLKLWYFLKFNSDLPGKIVDYKNYYVEPDASYNYWYYQEGEKIKTVTSIIEKVGYYIYSSTK